MAKDKVFVPAGDPAFESAVRSLIEKGVIDGTIIPAIQRLSDAELQTEYDALHKAMLAATEQVRNLALNKTEVAEEARRRGFALKVRP